MRQLGLCLLLLPILVACGGAETPGADDNNIIKGGPIQIKTLGGDFQTINESDLVSVKIKVVDPNTQTSYERVFTSSKMKERLQQVGLQKPGKKSTLNMTFTGEVTLNYFAEELQAVSYRVFKIYDGRYLQDAVFNDVVYTAEESLTFVWLQK